MQRRIFSLSLFVALILTMTISPDLLAGEAVSKSVILATTTSTQDSGLLDVLVPLFEKKTGYKVKGTSKNSVKFSKE